MAEESLMGEYYGPLWEDYHLLGLDTESGTRKGRTDELCRRLESYMGDNVWKYQCDSCSITGYESFLTEGGRSYVEQAVAYEKYAAVEQVAETLLDKAGIFSDYGKTMKIFKKSLSIEEELADIDKKTLELMKAVDGIDISEWDPSDASECASSDVFAKKIFTGEITPGTVGINHPGLFNVIKDRYVNPAEMLKSMEDNVTLLKQLRYEADSAEYDAGHAEKEIGEIEKSLKDTEKQIKEKEKEQKALEKAIKKLKKAKNKEKLEENEEKLKSCIENISELKVIYEDICGRLQNEKNELEKKQEKKKSAEKTIRSLEESYRDSLKTLKALINGEKECTEDALKILNDIDEKREKAGPMISDYESFLLGFEGSINAESMDEFKKSLDEMKRYVEDDKGNGRIVEYDTMRNSLEENLRLLNGIPNDFFDAGSIKDADKLEKTEQVLTDISEMVGSLGYEGMYFDYSGLCDRNSSADYSAILGGWFAEGIAELIFGEGDLSENIMASEFLPSAILEISSAEDDFSIMTGESSLDSGQLLDLVTDESSFFGDIAEKIDSAGKAAGDSILLSMYQKDCFKSYISTESKGDTVMEYETEYILGGYPSDSMNLLAATCRVFLVRVVVDCLYALCSVDKMKEAEAITATVFSLVGLTFLEKIAAVIIVIIMGFAQAIIETRAIMEGKSVAVIPTGDNFCVSVFELPFITSLVDEKTKAVKDSPFGLKYDEYLLIFLIIADRENQTARALDLIQENIRYRYDEDFLLNNCITGFAAEADFYVGTSYVSIFDSFFNIMGLEGLQVHSAEKIRY